MMLGLCLRYVFHLFLAIIAVLAATSVAMADADLSILRKAGSYVILLDKDGKALTGAYWLSPDIKAIIHSEDSSLGSPVIYADRDAFPRYMAVFEYFFNERLGYIPDPVTLDVGKPSEIVETVVPVTMTGGVGDTSQRKLRYTLDSKASSTIQNIQLVSRAYTLEDGKPVFPGRAGGKRVYVDTLDLDLSADAAALVATIEIGSAASSGDFQAIYTQRSAILLPKLAECIERARASAEFKAAARKQHDTADAWMATKFPLDGIVWWARADFKPDDMGPDLMRFCP